MASRKHAKVSPAANSDGDRAEGPAQPAWMASLRPYQAEGMRFLAALSKAVPRALVASETLPALPGGTRARLLADKPGLGKTRTALAAARLAAPFKRDTESSDRPIIVITTSSGRNDWRREAGKFWPELPVYVAGFDDAKFSGGSKRKSETAEEFAARRDAKRDAFDAAEEKKLDASLTHPGLFVINYESVDRLHEYVTTRGVTMLGTVIVDEAHLLKKPTSLYSKLVRPVIARGDETFLLTATPIHNRPEDLHNLLDLCSMNRFGSKVSWAEKFFQIHVGKNGFGRTIGRLIHREALAASIAPFVLARNANEVMAGMPPCIREIHHVQTDGNVLRISPALLRSRKIMDEQLRKAAELKLDTAVQMAMDADEEPIVIYTYEKAHARYIANKLRQKGQEVMMATGDTAPKQRDRDVEIWKGGGSRVLVATFDALRESATLTRADHMVLVDIDWLPGKMIQIEGRIHPSRQPEDQRRPARYTYLVTEGGPDEIVAERCIEKIEDAEGVVGTADSDMQSLRESMYTAAGKVLEEQESPEAALADLVERLNAREERMKSVLDVGDFNFSFAEDL